MNLHSIAFFIALCLFAIHGYAQTATIEISVKRLEYNKKNTSPFPGVGIFSISRGDSKLDGAKCPDKSSSTGIITCSIPCNPGDSSVMQIKVIPPSDQDYLAGWITPGFIEAEIVKCKAKPKTLTMVYEDARYALRKFIRATFYASASNNSGNDGLPEAISIDSAVIAKVTALSSSQSGRLALIETYKLATETASMPSLQSYKLTSDQQRLSEALAKWQILSKSALIQSKVKRTAMNLGSKAKPTTDLTTYLSNLHALDIALQNSAQSQEQILLSDDIKALSESASTGKAAAHVTDILKAW